MASGGITAEALRLMADKGLSAHDIAEIAAALTPVRSSGAERQARYRARRRNGRDVTRDVTPSPNDIYSNPLPANPVVSKETTTPLADRVVEAWNEGPGRNGGRLARTLDSGRRRSLAQRVKDYGEDAVFEAIRNAAASEFHCGKNDRGWRVHIGWMLKSPENFLKLLELEGPPQPISINPEERRAAEERTAAIYERIGRTDEAAEIRRRWSTGPPRQIGELTSKFKQSGVGDG